MARGRGTSLKCRSKLPLNVGLKIPIRLNPCLKSWIRYVHLNSLPPHLNLGKTLYLKQNCNFFHYSNSLKITHLLIFFVKPTENYFNSIKAFLKIRGGPFFHLESNNILPIPWLKIVHEKRPKIWRILDH